MINLNLNTFFDYFPYKVLCLVIVNYTQTRKCSMLNVIIYYIKSTT